MKTLSRVPWVPEGFCFHGEASCLVSGKAAQDQDLDRDLNHHLDCDLDRDLDH